MSEDGIAADELKARFIDALKISSDDARDRVAGLVAGGYLEIADGRVISSQQGEKVHRRTRASIAEITERLWVTYQPTTRQLPGGFLPPCWAERTPRSPEPELGQAPCRPRPSPGARSL